MKKGERKVFIKPSLHTMQGTTRPVKIEGNCTKHKFAAYAYCFHQQAQNSSTKIPSEIC